LPTLFSSTVEYAMRAIVALAAREAVATAKDLATVTQSPPGYVSKIMQTLVEADLVLAKRGPNGGFSLARPPTEITLLDVVNAVDTLERITACPLGLPEHADDLCPLHKVMDDVIAYVQETLGKYTIAELMSRPPASITPLQLTISAAKPK
jgi:Rrf2 family protein